MPLAIPRSELQARFLDSPNSYLPTADCRPAADPDTLDLTRPYRLIDNVE